MLRINNQGVPAWENAFLRGLFPLAAAFVKRELGVGAGTVAADGPRVRHAFDAIAARLADGRRYLCGERFTAADLTFACLASPVVVPPQYGLPLPAARRVRARGGRRRSRSSAPIPRAPTRWSCSRPSAEAAARRPRRRSSSARGRARPRPGGGRRGRCGARRRGRRRSAAATRRGPARATGASSARPRRRPGGTQPSNARAFAASTVPEIEPTAIACTPWSRRSQPAPSSNSSSARRPRRRRRSSRAKWSSAADQVPPGTGMRTSSTSTKAAKMASTASEDPVTSAAATSATASPVAAAPAAPADRSRDGEHADTSTADPTPAHTGIARERPWEWCPPCPTWPRSTSA